MQHGQPWTPDDFVNHIFSPSRFGRGYDQDEVDHFLDRCVAQLRRHRGEPVATQEGAIDAARAAAADRSKGWIDRWLARRLLQMLESQAKDPASAPHLRPITSAEVVAHAFRETQFRDGYDTAEVDEVLDRMVEVLESYERRGSAPA